MFVGGHIVILPMEELQGQVFCCEVHAEQAGSECNT